jgi:hypothetical protein
MHASSTGSIAGPADSNTSILADSRAVTTTVGLYTATAYTDIWHPGSLLPSHGSDQHLLDADITRTAFIAANRGPGDNSANITSTGFT